MSFSEDGFSSNQVKIVINMSDVFNMKSTWAKKSTDAMWLEELCHSLYVT